MYSLSVPEPVEEAAHLPSSVDVHARNDTEVEQGKEADLESEREAIVEEVKSHRVRNPCFPSRRALDSVFLHRKNALRKTQRNWQT